MMLGAFAVAMPGVHAGVGELGPAGRGTRPRLDRARERPVVQRQNLILGRLRIPERLHLLELVGHRRREVVRLGIVLRRL